MKRMFLIVAMGLALGATNPASLLAAPRDGSGSVGTCKSGRNQPVGCRALAAPEIDPAGGFVPMVLIAGTLLLLAEGVRRTR